MCQGVCSPTQLQCNGQQPQNCSATGTWQNNGACGGQVCFNGVCTGADCSSYTMAECNGTQRVRCPVQHVLRHGVLNPDGTVRIGHDLDVQQQRGAVSLPILLRLPGRRQLLRGDQPADARR